MKLIVPHPHIIFVVLSQQITIEQNQLAPGLRLANRLRRRARICAPCELAVDKDGR